VSFFFERGVVRDVGALGCLAGVYNVFSIECVLDRVCCLQNVISIECISSIALGALVVSCRGVECFLYRMSSL
jgi:hypothetical protein